MKPFYYKDKPSPIIISVPHAGTYLPEKLYKRLSPEGHELADTDWFVDRIFSFANSMDVSFLTANYSRTYIDLNRPTDGSSLYAGVAKFETGLCPTHSFAGNPLYLEGCEPTADEIKARIEQVWLPYHTMLQESIAQKLAQFGYVIVLDAHSIKSEVPKLFEGHLAPLNFGTNGGNSASAELTAMVLEHIRENSDLHTTLNDRFKGGFITRHYGKPSSGVHTIQLEMAQKIYMHENTHAAPELRFDTAKAVVLQPLLKSMVEVMMHAHDQ